MKRFVAILLCSLFLLSCDFFVSILFDNRSSREIRFLFERGEAYNNTLYPDTTLSPSEHGLVVNKYKSDMWTIFGPSDIKGAYNYADADTICFFVIDNDTITKYGWEDVRTNYRILVRYDISLNDMERLRSTVVYPPDSTMKDIKMWPPYEEVLRKEESGKQ
jgi:hypothetical protein